MNDLHVEMYKVKDLYRLLRQRVFAVPQVQREFVWTGKKAASLMDSIYRNLPIGTLLVWRTGRQNRNHLREELTLLPTFNPANDEVLFLIDGQQRLSVLHQVAKGEQKENWRGQVVDFNRVTFAVAPFEDDGQPSSFSYRPPVEGRYVALPEILAEDWGRRFRKLAEYKRRKIKECRERILYYPVPIVSVHTNDIRKVRTAFIRINSGGMRVTSADEAFALASRFRLRHLARVLRAGLEGLAQISPDPLLLAFAFCNGAKEVGKKTIYSVIEDWEGRVKSKQVQLKQFNREWKRFSDAVQRAADFLRHEFLVYNVDFLPSENMLATLSFFFYHNGANPRTRQRVELRKWFWATAVCQRYTGRGYRNNMLADLDFFKRLARGVKAKFKLSDLADQADVRRTQYVSGSAIANAFFCLLASRGPRSLENGEIMPLEAVAARANRKNEHHIFPKALMQRCGFGYRDYNSICNLCLLPAEENQSIGSQRPRDYLATVKRSRRFSTMMKSHLIPYRAESDVWDSNIGRGFRKFLRQRTDLICKAFEQQAGIRLFKRDQ